MHTGEVKKAQMIGMLSRIEHMVSHLEENDTFTFLGNPLNVVQSDVAMQIDGKNINGITLSLGFFSFSDSGLEGSRDMVLIGYGQGALLPRKKEVTAEVLLKVLESAQEAVKLDGVELQDQNTIQMAKVNLYRAFTKLGRVATYLSMDNNDIDIRGAGRNVVVISDPPIRGCYQLVVSQGWLKGKNGVLYKGVVMSQDGSPFAQMRSAKEAIQLINNVTRYLQKRI